MKMGKEVKGLCMIVGRGERVGEVGKGGCGGCWGVFGGLLVYGCDWI